MKSGTVINLIELNWTEKHWNWVWKSDENWTGTIENEPNLNNDSNWTRNRTELNETNWTRWTVTELNWIGTAELNWTESVVNWMNSAELNVMSRNELNWAESNWKSKPSLITEEFCNGLSLLNSLLKSTYFRIYSLNWIELKLINSIKSNREFKSTKIIAIVACEVV